MIVQCTKDGKGLYCKACGHPLRSRPICDPGPFCVRKGCIKAREQKVLDQLAKEASEEGGPALPVEPLS